MPVHTIALCKVIPYGSVGRVALLPQRPSTRLKHDHTGCFIGDPSKRKALLAQGWTLTDGR